jgi:hypothetical protein
VRLMPIQVVSVERIARLRERLSRSNENVRTFEKKSPGDARDGWLSACVLSFGSEATPQTRWQEGRPSAKDALSLGIIDNGRIGFIARFYHV